MRLVLLSFLSLVVGPLMTTGGVSTSPDAANNNAAADRSLRRKRSRSRLGFYESRPDIRECASPFCGGAFVRPIDGSLIKCPGDKKASVECYVGAMRYPGQPQQRAQNSTVDKTTTDDGTTIVFGRIVPGKNYTGNASSVDDFVVRKHGKAVSAFLQQVSIVVTMLFDRVLLFLSLNNRQCTTHTNTHISIFFAYYYLDESLLQRPARLSQMRFSTLWRILAHVIGDHQDFVLGWIDRQQVLRCQYHPFSTRRSDGSRC
jgi:hypothetical protein